MIEIYSTDTYEETARKIFFKFDLLQNCAVIGYVDMYDTAHLQEKGKAVIDYIEELDKLHNHGQYGNKLRRNKSKPQQSVGDNLCHKTFRWSRVIINNQPKYTIWRIQ